MKKALKIVLHIFFLLPLAGWLSLYLFVVLAMLSMGTTDIYLTDPKNTPLGENLYSGIFYFFSVSLFIGIPLLLFLLGGFLLFARNNKNFPSRPVIWISVLGIILMLITFIFDMSLGHYLYWFLD